MRKLLCIALFLLTATTAAFSQQYVAQLKEDSMKKVLKTARDTQRVNTLNLLARNYLYMDQDGSKQKVVKELTEEAYTLAQKLNYHRGIGNALLNKGIVNMYESHFNESIAQLKTATAILKKEKDLFGLAAAYDFIGNAKQQKGESRSSITYSDSAEHLYRQLGDTVTAVWSLMGKGRAYFTLGDFTNGYKTQQMAYELAPQKDTTLKTICLFYLANLFLGAGLPELTLEQVNIILGYFPDAVTHARIIGSQGITAALILGGEAYLQLNQLDSAQKIAALVRTPFEQKQVQEHLFLGKLYTSLKLYDKALLHLQKGYAMVANGSQPFFVSHTARELAVVHLRLNELAKAKAYAEQALETAQKIDARLEIRNAAGTLAEIYDRQNNYQKAYYYTKLQKSLNDSLMPEEYKRKLSLIGVQNELAIQKQQAKFLAKENTLRQQQLKRESLVRNILIAGLVLFVFLSLMVFRNVMLKRKNEKLQLEHRLRLQEVESESARAKLQQHAAELEMQALRAQMNPHFIFNCLNAINHFILKNETETASDFLTKFSRLIRLVLHSSSHKYISLHDELETLKLYIGLELVRFKNHFSYTLHCDASVDTESVQIPPMLLQPFVENAIWHGLMHKKEGGQLSIDIREENDTLYCTIQDNGIGRRKAAELKSKSASHKKSMGMEITANRLKMLNGDNHQFSFLKIIDLENEAGEGVGTKVVLQIPAKMLEPVSV